MKSPYFPTGEIMRSKARFATSLSGAALAAVAAAAILLDGTARAAPAKLSETGSTLLYPLFNLWAAEYTDAQITTQGTGSGAGISEAISGTAQIGASDAYLTNAQMKSNPGMLNIPLAISSQMVNYNVPGLNNQHLKLSGPVLAEIYQGKVKYWDDPAIAKINPGVKLPHNAIVPVHRSDGSGDTFIFTQYLSYSTPDWSNSLGYGTTVNWPAVQGGIGAVGNPGMVNASKSTPYSIAYIGISFKNATASAGLGVARLKNRDGKFVLPDHTTVSDAVTPRGGFRSASRRGSWESTRRFRKPRPATIRTTTQPSLSAISWMRFSSTVFPEPRCPMIKVVRLKSTRARFRLTDRTVSRTFSRPAR
jgi:phosphate transport system substrate-binding protein